MEPTAPARAIAAVVSGIVGASIGSFLNVVIYRVPRAMSVVRPRSHCPRCGTELGEAENIPVISWLVLRGRCRHCSEPISARYPIVELTTTALFVAFALLLRSFAPVAPLDCLAAAALAAAMIAFDHLTVARSIAVAALLGSASLAVVSVVDHADHRLLWAAIGAAAGALAAGFVPWVVRRLGAPEGTAPHGGAAQDGIPQAGDPGGLPLAVVIVALSFAAGWLWRPGGLVVAGVALVSCTLGLGRRAALRNLPGAACLLGVALLVAAGPLGHN
jgi:leader peptidase (prepilin peptidase)/N-methyltransferase